MVASIVKSRAVVAEGFDLALFKLFMVSFRVVLHSKPRDFLLGNLDLSEHIFVESFSSGYEHRTPFLLFVVRWFLPRRWRVHFVRLLVDLPLFVFFSERSCCESIQ